MNEAGHDAQCERSFQGIPSPSNRQWCYCVGRALRRSRPDLDVPVRETGGARLAGSVFQSRQSDRRAGAGVAAPVRPRPAVDLTRVEVLKRRTTRTLESGAAAARLAVRLGYRYPAGVRASMLLQQAMLEMVEEVSPL